VEGVDPKLVFPGVGMVMGSYFNETDLWTSSSIAVEVEGRNQSESPHRYAQFVLAGKDQVISGF
jgi:hypothetical protein